MANKTSIEWTGESWNPFKGCSKVSQGCKYCYAEVMAKRLKAMGKPGYEDVVDDRGWTGKIVLDEKVLMEPYQWRKPRIVFTSMTDLFHENAPNEWIQRLVDVVYETPQHTYLWLSKRPERMRDSMYNAAEECPNLWLGTSIENQVTADDRLPYLYDLPRNFVSYEPALTLVEFDEHFKAHKSGVVIMGGESGPHSRPFDLDWARETKRQCEFWGVLFFLKQLGRHFYDDDDRHVFPHNPKGSDPSEWPEDLRGDQDVTRLPWGNKLWEHQ